MNILSHLFSKVWVLKNGNLDCDIWQTRSFKTSTVLNRHRYYGDKDNTRRLVPEMKGGLSFEIGRGPTAVPPAFPPQDALPPVYPLPWQQHGCHFLSSWPFCSSNFEVWHIVWWQSPIITILQWRARKGANYCRESQKNWPFCTVVRKVIGLNSPSILVQYSMQLLPFFLKNKLTLDGKAKYKKLPQLWVYMPYIPSFHCCKIWWGIFQPEAISFGLITKAINVETLVLWLSCPSSGKQRTFWECTKSS